MLALRSSVRVEFLGFPAGLHEKTGSKDDSWFFA